MFVARLVFLTAAATILASTSDGRPPVAVPSQSEPSKPPCCFNNPAYTGTCKVQPAGDETCASILAYLNNPAAQGKSYCGGTTVRQGWAEVSCEGGGTSTR